MGEAKRERRRLKRAHKRKQKAFARNQITRGAGREVLGMEEADQAAHLFRRGDIARALRHASRAATLNPRDREIAFLYVAIAERYGNPLEERQALEHLLRLVEPDATLLIRLAYLHLDSGDLHRAEESGLRARNIFPRRMRDRKRWLALLEHVEARLSGQQAERRTRGTLGRLPSAALCENGTASGQRLSRREGCSSRDGCTVWEDLAGCSV